MKKLDKYEKANYEKLYSNVEEAYSDLESKRDSIQESIDQLESELKSAKDAYNGHLAALREFSDNARCDIQEYFDSKSEKWQESYVGEMMSSWIEQWDELATIDDLEIDDLEKIEIPDCSLSNIAMPAHSAVKVSL